MIISDTELQKLLLKENAVKEKLLSELMISSKNQRMSLQNIILGRGIFSDEQLGKILAKSVKVPFVIPSQFSIPKEILEIIPERVARKYKIVAFAEDKTTIDLATSDPTQKEVEEMIAKKTGKKIIVHFATEQELEKIFQLYKKDLEQALERMLKGGLGTDALTSDAPIAKIVDMLITYAYRERASDIHIEPEEDRLLVRFRIDGVLHDALSIDKNLHGRIITRIKVLSKLKTDEHLSAQDGKMRLMIDEKLLDIRVSIVSATEGEKVVLRLLSSNSRRFSLEELGMRSKDVKKVNTAVQKTYGMILSTGPTGSGKTTTIYSLLSNLNTREKNITTIEDPVEYRIKGITQIHVNIKTNLTFISGLRSILRQDPNVIFVGEIRDAETAGIAVNAALTGHLVLSTLHTNDAATAPPRLIDMKVEPFLVASTVNLIIAQRLIRKICISCKTTITREREELLKSMSEKLVFQFFGNKKKVALHEGKGCASCHFTGYDGRIGIFEVMEISKTMKKLIIEKQDSDIIQRQAVKEGMVSMFEDGLTKAAEGITTLEEVLRVIKKESL